MGHHHHHHDHRHQGDHGSSVENLRLALVLNAGFALLELVGGIWTGSVAILSDAVHDLGDALALASALYLEGKAQRGSDQRFSYGYRRMSLLSALITGAFLLGGSLWVLSEAIPRLLNPVTPKLGGMIAFALVGVAVNGYAAWRVQTGNTLNERMVSWHLLEDVMGWVAVLIGAIVMAVTDLPIIDPILSVAFTLFILWNVFRNLRTTVNVFLQGVPEGMDYARIHALVEKVEGVMGIHDVHMWTLDGASHVLTVHVVVASRTTIQQAETVKHAVREALKEVGNFHTTIEIESEAADCAKLDCVSP